MKRKKIKVDSIIIKSIPTIKNMKKLGFILFSLFAFAFFIFSCSTKTFNIEINKIGTYPHPLIEPLPIKVGVYYGNDFGTFETTEKVEMKDARTRGTVFTFIYNTKMGKANIALFDYILSTLFEKVTPLQYLSKGSDHKKDIDLIVEPTVHSFTYPSPTNPPVPSNYGVITIHIIYEINFYLPEGEKIGSWSIEGGGYALPRLNETAVVELTQMAMREVAAKFMADFCNQEDIKKMFYSQCNQ